MKPEEALEAARAAARPFEEGPVTLDAGPLEAASTGRLAEWAVIAPQMDRVYSDRRGGRALGAVKRGLVRALRQYFAEMIAQENRYNALATAHIVRLEERVRALEAELARRR